MQLRFRFLSRQVTEVKWNTLQKARVTKAFTNLYPQASTDIITPEHFVEFVYE